MPWNTVRKTLNYYIFQISGLDTNVNFLIDLASHPSFQAGDVHTGFIDTHLDSLFPPIQISDETITQAIAAIVTNERYVAIALSIRQGCRGSPFAACDGFRLNSYLERTLSIESNGQKYNIHIRYVGSNYEIKIDDNDWKPFSINSVKDSYPNRFTLKLHLDGKESIFSTVIKDNYIDIFNQNGRNEFSLVLPKFFTECSTDGSTDGETDKSSDKVVSPMPGIFDKILVEVGEWVEVGQPVAVIIAMKMEYVLKAPKNGTIKSVSKKLGNSVIKGEIIVAFECDEQKPKI
ncbi:methylcrotonoyl-CoA carboxylase subunit alpha, mitochondrial-like [Contarinia nasturtii]|uniref:methylcrotonoyl-CoA carboxylase subunit alpha, mitochondrial-like n=1 Tax=Contarinia nasturtii TaxID=265458 RepID=UPI0012D4510D|nr:methylcrotonoyl-CoA carboxylase subunit alpha, mitochondrial-like [Contarinia nasturtii]